jgi:DeoR/GlpR family transcriptional regulator of sugar metabolism
MNDRTIPAQRRNEILAQLEKDQFVRVSFLSESMGVSEATARRDLEAMEKQGLVERTHGGAILSHRMVVEPDFSTSESAHAYEKECIGAVAARLVESGDMIFINFGTTNAHVARALRTRTELENVTVITNNLSVLFELQNVPQFHLVCLGGHFRKLSNSLVGLLTLNCLEGMFANKSFIGVDGISFKYGCTTPVETDSQISRKMIDNTHGKVIVVADHSKWGVVSNYQVTPLESISTLVSNQGISDEAMKILDEFSVEVIIAPNDIERN